MIVSYATDKGLVRQCNEDSYLVQDPHFFAVADGMGGHAAGEVASSTLIQSILEGLKSQNKIDEEILCDLVKEANHRIFKAASENEAYAGMGSTISLMAVEEEKITWVHVGDSRIYLLRDGELRQLTTDHSFVNELLQHKKELDMDVNEHKGKNILTRAVGVAFTLKVDSGTENICSNDKLLLCTDGLTNMVPLEEIKEICSSDEENKAQVLVNKALAYGGKDNITCIVVEIHD